MAEVVQGRRLWEYFAGIEEEDIVYAGSCDDDDTILEEEVSVLEEEVDADLEDLDTELDQLDIEPEEMEETDSEDNSIRVATGGTRIQIIDDPDHEDGCTYKVLGRSKRADETVWMSEVVVFLNELQNKVIHVIPDKYLPVLTAHKRGDNTFRAHPNYRGEGPWKDWALVDWGTVEGTLPCHIWCFVSLLRMPIGKQRIEHGGITLKNGVYAVVEVAQYDTNMTEQTKSDLFTPLLLDTKGIDSDGDVVGRRFYLADTSAIVGPCCVIPDIGGPRNAYFQVKNRSQWAKEFISWLKQPHKDDGMEYSDEDSAEEE
jgi:hypothetical protein